MILEKVNDNELIYLIREGNEEALEIMFLKYEPLIKSKIIKFKFDIKNFDDYLQEGRICLNKAIRLYNADSPKTFNKFFDLIITNRFRSILRKNKIDMDYEFIDENKLIDKQPIRNDKLEEIDFSYLKLSSLEKRIYELRFLRNYNVKDICQLLKVEEKTVYNTIQRIKKKLETLKIK